MKISVNHAPMNLPLFLYEGNRMGQSLALRVGLHQDRERTWAEMPCNVQAKL